MFQFIQKHLQFGIKTSNLAPTIAQISDFSQILCQVLSVRWWKSRSFIFIIISTLASNQFPQIFVTLTASCVFLFLIKFCIDINIRTYKYAVIVQHIDHILRVTLQIDQRCPECGETAFQPLNQQDLHNFCQTPRCSFRSQVANLISFPIFWRSKIFNGSIAFISQTHFIKNKLSWMWVCRRNQVHRIKKQFRQFAVQCVFQRMRTADFRKMEISGIWIVMSPYISSCSADQ